MIRINNLLLFADVFEISAHPRAANGIGTNQSVMALDKFAASANSSRRQSYMTSCDQLHLVVQAPNTNHVANSARAKNSLDARASEGDKINRNGNDAKAILPEPASVKKAMFY